MNQIATIGDNQPPRAAALQDELSARHLQLAARRDELLEAMKRAPEKVTDDETAGRVGDFIKQIMACHKNAEATRVAEKEPHLESCRVVDGWFKKITDPLASAKKAMEERLNKYLVAKAEAARREAEEKARREREEAERLAAAATTDKQLDVAIAHEAAADAAAVTAQAKPAELSRTRGDFGAVASLRTTWDFEVTDISAVPAEFLMVNDVAVRGSIKGGRRVIPGIRIFEKQTAVVR